mmetsp:Transcript_15983/g.31602  ORF Transcript_15983/g.31602 Transcript_15983/m.31602 type:complete len:229 (-) Transcript_15983:40-726(-)
MMPLPPRPLVLAAHAPVASRRRHIPGPADAHVGQHRVPYPRWVARGLTRPPPHIHALVHVLHVRSRDSLVLHRRHAPRRQPGRGVPLAGGLCGEDLLLRSEELHDGHGQIVCVGIVRGASSSVPLSRGPLRVVLELVLLHGAHALLRLAHRGLHGQGGAVGHRGRALHARLLATEAVRRQERQVALPPALLRRPLHPLRHLEAARLARQQARHRCGAGPPLVRSGGRL